MIRMKSIQFLSFKMSFSTVFFSLLMLSVCAQSCTDAKTEKGTQEKITMDLSTAVVTGNLDVVKQHIAAGTDLDKKDPMSGSSPLITATVFNKLEIAEALVKGGADLKVKNNDGSTALHTAAFFGRVEMVQLLLDAKADKSLRNNYGATARESILGDFEEMRGLYEMFQSQLKPMGLVLDMEELKNARPVIAEMLK